MRRKIILLTLLAFNLCVFAQQQDPVLMRINNKNVTRSEFEYIYNKNNSNNELDKKTLDEYVDLFVNFKLKVAAAEASGIDTTKAFRDELSGYRQQLIKPYLTNDSVDQASALEVYNRLKENIEISHILITVKPNASAQDTLDAYNRAERARQRIENGEPFEQVARLVSEDKSVRQNGGYLGYFTALQMVYPFEDAAYKLKIGEVSAPVRTDFGYHVIKVTNRRPDMGQVLVAHIFKYLPQDASQGQEQKVIAEIDSLYQALQNGASFSELARKYSDDKATASRGGELPWVGFRQTVKEFEDVAFSLSKDQYSRPFRSPSGYHIVKLIDRKTIEPFEEKKEEILRRLNRQGRGNKGADARIASLKKDYSFTVNTPAYNELESALRNLTLGEDIKKTSVASLLNKTLFTLDGKTYSQQDFIKWQSDNSQPFTRQFKLYTDKVILDYEDSRLEIKYPDFGYLMQEYRDGILLFEISNNTIWDKASKDDNGLESYFKENKSDYSWDSPRFKGLIVYVVDKKTVKQLKKLIKKIAEDDWAGKITRTFNNDSVTNVKVEKGLYAKGANKYVDKLVFKTGKFEPLKEFPYTETIGKKLKKGPETYRDVRGPVTADYQNYLESVWIQQLKAKFKVEINQQVLKTVNNH